MKIPQCCCKTQYAVVAELADALSSGGSGVIRESSNLSDRTSKKEISSSDEIFLLHEMQKFGRRLRREFIFRKYKG